MKAQIIRSGLFLVLMLSLLGCAMGTVDTIESGNKAEQNSRVLIATQKSDFKQAVISEIRNTLESNSCYIKVVDVKRLPNESTQSFHAIIILNECMAGRPDPRVESFIDNVPDKQKVIILTTGRLESWKPESQKVDAMTSASVMDRSKTIGQSLADKALEIIRSQRNL